MTELRERQQTNKCEADQGDDVMEEQLLQQGIQVRAPGGKDGALWGARGCKADVTELGFSSESYRLY